MILKTILVLVKGRTFTQLSQHCTMGICGFGTQLLSLTGIRVVFSQEVLRFTTVFGCCVLSEDKVPRVLVSSKLWERLGGSRPRHLRWDSDGRERFLITEKEM